MAEEKQTIGRTILLGAAWGIGFGTIMGLGSLMWKAITKKNDDDDESTLDKLVGDD
jgi:hypothetical protein